MTIMRPRFNDVFQVDILQENADFAIPFISEDLPLFVDPFLLWKSPSQQDISLHMNLMGSFNTIVQDQDMSRAIEKLQLISECNEVGLGGSAKKKGVRIGAKLAQSVVENCQRIRNDFKRDIKHLEEIQLITDQISKDRISDFTCCLLKSFLVDFTIDQCNKYRLPLEDVEIEGVYDIRDGNLKTVKTKAPINPQTSEPILFVPKRWLRYSPWINYEDYFENHYLKEYVETGKNRPERFEVLNYNRDNYDVILQYIEKKEKSFEDCKNDPLFKSIPILSAKRSFAEIKKLPSGKDENADKKYEDEICKLLPSLFYPHLDFAAVQSRTDSGKLIRDLIFYNNKSQPFLSDLWDKYDSRQIVFELKNVRSIDRDHINQINRYLKDSFGNFGVLVTRNPLSKSMQKNLIDLWSGQRRMIIVLTDENIEMMVTVFESKQRYPIEIINKKIVEFLRMCPG